MAIPVPVPVLDHVVINVADRLDEASALYRRLGFQLSDFVIVAQDPALSAQVYSHLFGTVRILACQDGAFVMKAGEAKVRFARVPRRASARCRRIMTARRACPRSASAATIWRR